jgi:hypothetical protein
MENNTAVKQASNYRVTRLRLLFLMWKHQLAAGGGNLVICRINYRFAALASRQTNEKNHQFPTYNSSISNGLFLIAMPINNFT